MSSGLVLGVQGIVGKDVRSRTRGLWRPVLSRIPMRLASICPQASHSGGVIHKQTARPAMSRAVRHGEGDPVALGRQESKEEPR